MVVEIIVIRETGGTGSSAVLKKPVFKPSVPQIRCMFYAKFASQTTFFVRSSDDRNPTVIREWLESVVSSQSSLNTTGGGDGESGTGAPLKPSCLIIDEVDGVLPAAVEVLAEAAAAPLMQVRKRGKKKALVLKRPVICICNDLYVPPLFYHFVGISLILPCF